MHKATGHEHGGCHPAVKAPLKSPKITLLAPTNSAIPSNMHGTKVGHLFFCDIFFQFFSQLNQSFARGPENDNIQHSQNKCMHDESIIQDDSL